jgi:hypothetical protein
VLSYNLAIKFKNLHLMGTGPTSQIILVIILLGICSLVGLFGKTRKIGFWRASIISLLLTFGFLLILGGQDTSEGTSVNPLVLLFGGPTLGLIICLFYKKKLRD